MTSCIPYIYIDFHPADLLMQISLRPWTMDDLDTLVRYADNKHIADHLADAFPSPYTREEGIKFIKRASNDKPLKIAAILVDQKVVGSIGIFPDTDIHRKNAAIAYWVAEPYWGKGIAPQAIRLMVIYAFKTFDINRIYAKPFGDNQNSHRALEKAGFSLEATLHKTIFKNGKWFDELIYSLRRTDESPSQQ